jgi:hypothetical protein
MGRERKLSSVGHVCPLYTAPARPLAWEIILAARRTLAHLPTGG